jgi:hypothetical protein
MERVTVDTVDGQVRVTAAWWARFVGLAGNHLRTTLHLLRLAKIKGLVSNNVIANEFQD